MRFIYLIFLFFSFSAIAETKPATPSSTALYSVAGRTGLSWLGALQALNDVGMPCQSGMAVPSGSAGQTFVSYTAAVGFTGAARSNGSQADPMISSGQSVSTVCQTAKNGAFYQWVSAAGSGITRMASDYFCPDSSWTLSGQTCSRPDCVAPQVRNPAGVCAAPPVNCTGKAGQFSSDTFLDAGTTKVGDFVMIDGCRAKVTFRDSYTNCSFGEGGLGTCTKNVDMEYQFDGTNTEGAPTPDKTQKPTDADRCRSSGQNVAVTSSGTSCTSPSADQPTKTEGAKQKETTNPDGSTTTEKKVITEICTGSGACSTTITTTIGGKNPDGTPKPDQVTTTSQGLGGKGSAQDGGTFCSENPDNVLCKRSEAKEKGKFEKRDTEIDEAKTALMAEFNSIRSSLSAKFSGMSGGGGSLPCPAPISILGKSISFGCTSGYEDVLAKIGQAVFFMAAFASAFIVLKR